MDARKNFAFGTLASGIDDNDLSLSVGSGEGARFPAVPFNAVIWQSTDYAHPGAAYHAGHAEIVRVTAISTDTLTITRAQESTSAVNLNTGGKTYQIWAGPTGQYWLDREQFNPETIILVEDFITGGNSSGALGKLGWRTTQIGAASSFTMAADSSAHIGITSISGITTAGNGGMIGCGVNADFVPNLSTFSGWEVQWIWKLLTATTSERVRIGFAPWNNTAIVPANGIFFRYDTNSGDSNWQFERVASSVSTVTDSGVAASTNWIKGKIRCVTAGELRFSLNGGSESVITTGLPTADLTPVAIIVTDTNGTRTLQVDFFSFIAKGLAR